MQTWVFDAPTGVYKSHAMSMKLRSAAIADTKFMQFVNPEPGYGKNKGESVTITRLSNITVPTDPTLTEGVRIPEDDFSLSTKAITVVEMGRAIPMTSYSQDLSEFNLMNPVQKKLREQMALSLDTKAASAFKSSSVKVCAIPDGVASLVFDTDGTPSTSATSNLKVYHVEQIRDYMFTTLNIPYYPGADGYICLISTKAKRGIMNDPAWEQWHKYTDPQNKFKSEIGKIEDIRFVEINNTSALSGSIGSGGVLGEAVFFGDDAVAMAVAQDPELRVEVNKGQDFGRHQAVAWYGILEFSCVWDTANPGEARIVRLTSS